MRVFDLVYLRCEETTNDGGYVITGYTKNPNKGNDIYVVKTDQEGNLNQEK